MGKLLLRSPGVFLVNAAAAPAARQTPETPDMDWLDQLIGPWAGRTGRAGHPNADPEKCRIDIHNFMWERIYFTALWWYNDDSKNMGGFIKAIASRSYNEARQLVAGNGNA